MALVTDLPFDWYGGQVCSGYTPVAVFGNFKSPSVGPRPLLFAAILSATLAAASVGFLLLLLLGAAHIPQMGDRRESKSGTGCHAVMTGGMMALINSTDGGATNDDAILKSSASGRVSNRIPSTRHKTERMIAVALVCAGTSAFAVESIVVGALFLGAGVSLVVHSRFIALWADEG